jgi:hypothetical protein
MLALANPRFSLSRLVLSTGIVAALEALSALTGSRSPVAAPASAQFPFRFRIGRAPTQVFVKEQVEVEQPGIEILTRGPVHEAYAEPIALDPEPGLAVPEPPPPVIDEEPPDEVPGLGTATLEWIPGYWGWDDDRDNYIWISGIWRNPPPECTWVPGYWAQTDEGYQWSPGFWDSDEDDEIEYLPRPPQNRDEGPLGIAPGPDYVWVPGTWYWQDSYDVEPLRSSGIRVEGHRSGFFWRPGFWLRARPDWVWIAAHYVWAPRGYVFVDGHWDYDLEQRGLLFAPIYIEPDVHISHAFRYEPRVAISTDVLITHLFTRPRYEHYYFGDYYPARFERRGIYPWFEVQRIDYDPIYAQQIWRHRGDEHWVTTLRNEYQARRENHALRPPDTWRRQVEEVQHASPEQRRAYTVARPLTELRRDNAGFDLRQLDQQRRQVITQHIQDLRDLRNEREKWEASDRPKATPREARPPHDAGPRELPPREPQAHRPAAREGQGPQPTQRESYRVTIPKKPISGKRPEVRDAAQQAPSRDDVPQPRKIKRDDKRPAGQERRP